MDAKKLFNWKADSRSDKAYPYHDGGGCDRGDVDNVDDEVDYQHVATSMSASGDIHHRPEYKADAKPVSSCSSSGGHISSYKEYGSNSSCSSNSSNMDLETVSSSASSCSPRARLLEAQMADVEMASQSYVLDPSSLSKKLLDSSETDDYRLMGEIDTAIQSLKTWRTNNNSKTSITTTATTTTTATVRSSSSTLASTSSVLLLPLSTNDITDSDNNAVTANFEEFGNMMELLNFENSKLSDDIDISNRKLALAINAANSLESTMRMRSPRHATSSLSTSSSNQRSEAGNKKVEELKAKAESAVEDEIREITYAHRIEFKDKADQEEMKLNQDMDVLEAQLRDFSSKLDSLL